MTTQISIPTVKEIFEKYQVLTVAKAIELKGRKIATTNAEYSGNKCCVNVFTIGEIVSQWELAEKDSDTRFAPFKSQADYWLSYMNEDQIEERKTNLVLLSEEGGQWHVAHTKYSNFYNEPTFTGSDADREVYFVEL
jgi:hypothetical protein